MYRRFPGFSGVVRFLTMEVRRVKELATARTAQVAYSFGEAVEGVRCVAAPVYKAGEVQPIAALSISGLEMRMNRERWQQMIDAVLRTAGHISTRLGRQGLPRTAER